MSLALGIAIRDITPPPGLPMGGYAARTELNRTTLDPLACRAAVFRDDRQAAALIAVDLLYVRDPWASAIRERVAHRLGIDAAAVMIAATHTHAGPAVFRSAMRETDELMDYERRLADIVDAAVEEAAGEMQPVTLHYGVGVTDGVAANRQAHEGAVDATVRAVVARGREGQPAGVIASFGCHPTVLSAANLAYSRDLFGAAADVVEAEVSAPVLLFNGAAGDVSTRFTRQAQTADEVARLGRRLARGVLAAIDAAQPIPNAPITGRTVDVPMTLRPLPTAAEAESHVAEAMARLAEARERAVATELRRLTARLEGAMAQLYLSQQGGVAALLGTAPERATVQTLELGGCDILGVPGEMFSAVGQRICESRPRPVLLAGYANDYVGYLVPPGSDGEYEALISFVTEESAAAVARALAGSEATA